MIHGLKKNRFGLEKNCSLELGVGYPGHLVSPSSPRREGGMGYDV